MRRLKLSLNTFLILVGLVLVVFVIYSNQTKSADLNESKFLNYSNSFTDTNLENPVGTGLEPSINVEAVTAGAFGEGGKAIFKWNAEKRWPMASLTKLMTTVVAYENIEFKEVIEITDKALETEGTAGNLSVGEKYILNDLVKAMLLASSNDAASAIAMHYGEEKFIAVMNEKAKELRMENTTFIDPTGISSQSQSTVEDLAKLINYIIDKHPEALAVTDNSSSKITELTSGRRQTIYNINTFAGKKNFIGGKTGATPEAGENLVSVFDIEGPKIIIVMGTEDRFGETEKILTALWQ